MNTYNPLLLLDRIYFGVNNPDTHKYFSGSGRARLGFKEAHENPDEFDFQSIREMVFPSLNYVRSYGPVKVSNADQVYQRAKVNPPNFT